MTAALILLVDDAPDIGVIVRRFGRQAGQTVAVEPSAEAAWFYLQNARRPDLAIFDVHLPGASGLELCRQVRATAGLSDLPVALFSHWQRPGDIAAGLDAGANFLLSKDLLCRPEAWQCRVAEILQPPAGRWPSFFLRCLDAPPAGLGRLAQELGPALVKAAGWLDAKVMHALVRRAWRQVYPKTLALAVDEPDRPLALDGLALDADRLSAHELPAFLRAFAEQVWCLLGTADCAPFWAALAAVAPPDCESPPRP
jgi:CheY-like chemotaxis protein